MLTLPSYAKVNLFLHVLRRRSDGYHCLKTVFERISLHDTLTLRLRRDSRIVLTCTDPSLPCDERNLAVAAALLLQAHVRRRQGKAAALPGCSIHIVKRIPLGSGMAGGSSNASTVLLGLNQLWKLGLGRPELMKLAARLGSDCPFFVAGCSFALASGRGEKIKPLPHLDRIRLWHSIIIPGINVPTPRIFRAWDRQPRIKLTKPLFSVNILCSALKSGRPADIGRYLFNSLEPVTAKLYPQVRLARRYLEDLGLKSILMSGSGPAVYALVGAGKEARALCTERVFDRSWKVFCARTV